MTSIISALTVKQWLQDGNEIAFLDVREHGQYGEGHPFFVVSAPYSRLEIDVTRLVPRRSTRIVLLDDDDGVAARAAARLAALGYTDVHAVEHGVNGWRAAGFELFQGVNLPSKTFGELAEHAYDTPRIQAQELDAMFQRGDRVVVLDGRPFEEYQKMNIPGAICCPNAELPYRIHSLVTDDTTPIVIHCAGRTRSIIGAQTLINAGVRNPVYALENGTQGWYLNDLQLEHGSSRRYPQVDADDPRLADRRAAAADQAERHGAVAIDLAQLQAWQNESGRSTFLLDVRTPEEFAAGTVAGAQHAPGGQLLQGTDQYVGVRGARLVLIDLDGIRAPLTAAWLRQIGHDAVVLKGDLPLAPPAAAHAGNGGSAGVAALPAIIAAEVAAGLAAGQLRLVDVRASTKYRAGHIDGAVWAIRPRVAAIVADDNRPVVWVADDARVAALAAADAGLAEGGRWLSGDAAAWRAAGLAVVATPDVPSNAESIDYLFFVHDRHDGNREAARQYLAWETGLIARLDASELASFRLPH
ncbi:rhodanese-like domain-containing protein [Pigmentiphaga litoralis]|uniref:rhodanese-like domain-containing protein n=1 Tax=Pigmentiphaga litoralis TaxID=516702 RepID=UPI003B4360A4